MANKQIGIIFGVQGNGSADGESGKRIAEQLQQIANEISKNQERQPKVTIGINTSATQKQIQSQLDKIAQSLKIEIGGNFGEAAEKKNKKSLKSAQNQFQKAYRGMITSGYGSESDLKKLGSLGMDSEAISDYLYKIESMKESFRNTMSQFNISENNGVLNFSKFSGTAQDLQDIVTQYNQLVNVDVKLTNLQNRNIVAIKNEELARNKLLNNMSQYLEKYKDTLKNTPQLSEQLRQLFNDTAAGKYKNQLSQVKSKFEELQVSIRNGGGETETLLQKGVRVVKEKLGFGLAASAAMILRQQVKQVVNNVIELDEVVVDLQIATGKTREETKQLVKEYSNLARELGATTSEVAKSADTWLRQGYNIEDTNELIKQSTMLSKLGQMESADASTALTSSLKGYQLAAEDAASVVDKLTAVDMEAAASAGDIATAMSECANSARIAGVDINTLIGYLTTVKEVTQDGSESVGTFAKTMFARMGNIKAGNLEDPETGENLKFWALAA